MKKDPYSIGIHFQNLFGVWPHRARYWIRLEDQAHPTRPGTYMSRPACRGVIAKEHISGQGAYLKPSPAESILLTHSAHLRPLGVLYSLALAPHSGQTPSLF